MCMCMCGVEMQVMEYMCTLIHSMLSIMQSLGTAYFSDSIKDFINKVLAPDPSRRMTLQDIKKHPWYLGETMS